MVDLVAVGVGVLVVSAGVLGTLALFKRKNKIERENEIIEREKQGYVLVQNHSDSNGIVGGGIA